MVRTYALNSCTSKIETDARVNDYLAAILPYNRERVGGACRDEVRIIEHTATIQFADTGCAVVTIFGRDIKADPRLGKVYSIGVTVR
jgi:hypothetical protein